MVNKNQMVRFVNDGQTVKQTNAVNKVSSAMDAIAIGVEAKLDPFSAYSKIVTQRTLEIARQLGMTEEEIQRWVRVRAKLDSQRDRVIKSEFSRNSTSAIFV